MKIHTNIDNFKANSPVVSIGIFDGVHNGHREIIRQITSLAKAVSGESVLISFWPHPRIVLNKDSENLRFLTTIEEKKSLLKNTGIDHMVIIPFTKSLSQQSACEFITETLAKKIRAKYLVLGFNNHFGRNKEENTETIKDCAERNGIIIKQAIQKLIDNDPVSSTLIRNLLWNGDIRKAKKLLGYDFFVKGTIVGGKKIGRKLGFPTANITPEEKHKLIPSNGVYAVFLNISDSIYGGMLNIGIRPTLNSDNPVKTIEVNIFNFSQNIYDQEVTLIFIDRIRDEIKFKNSTLLSQQLRKDKEAALKIIDKYKEHY
ncbi:MAG: bifunctional riboflavin kinase/FAD synthetase [Bacteroidales bacterium]|nr:bifunctional riboflavin kinase/FAD synthetase [Bacteroidales bacterium]